eukprot:Skav219064  [mRNA]  locus=scaffold1033:90657:91762:- [translate_table: standard]
MTGDDTLRCSNRSCKSRPRLHNAEVQFTPLQPFVWGKEPIDYKQFLCICFCMGAKIPQDSAIQFVRTSGGSLSGARHRVENIYGDLRMALAWQEHRLSARRHYASAVVEPDTCRTGSSNKDDARAHVGRTLVLTPPDKRSWSSFALPPSKSKEKSRGMGAEKISEVQKPLERVGGDQKAESMMSHIKNGMRRQQVLGRCGKQSAPKRNLEAVSSPALLRVCGIDTVLAAVAEYGRNCCNGVRQVSPKRCFQDIDWLFDLTQAAVGA